LRRGTQSRRTVAVSRSFPRSWVRGGTRPNLDPIRVPYRHGILHGLDLNYDNPLVAAKAWAALFAARDWALKVERGTVTAPPPGPKPSWRSLIHQILNNADDKARLEKWAPRSLTPGVDTPRSGKPEDYDEGTPERRLAEFLAAWEARNYGRMAQWVLRNPYEENWTINKVAGQLRAHYEGKRLAGFQLQAIDDQAAAVTMLTTEIRYELQGLPRTDTIGFRLIYSDPEGDVMVRGKPGGAWILVNNLV